MLNFSNVTTRCTNVDGIDGDVHCCSSGRLSIRVWLHNSDVKNGASCVAKATLIGAFEQASRRRAEIAAAAKTGPDVAKVAGACHLLLRGTVRHAATSPRSLRAARDRRSAGAMKHEAANFPRLTTRGRRGSDRHRLLRQVNAGSANY